MTTRSSAERPPAVSGPAGSGGGRPRSGQTIAYVVATALGGVSALVVLATELFSGDIDVLAALAWGALALLLLASAAHRWWWGGRAEQRSRLVVSAIDGTQVAEVVRESPGETDAVRRLRRAHPGLGLRDALDLVRGHQNRHGA